MLGYCFLVRESRLVLLKLRSTFRVLIDPRHDVLGASWACRCWFLYYLSLVFFSKRVSVEFF